MNRMFYVTSFQMFVETSPKFVYSYLAVLAICFGLGEFTNEFLRKFESNVLRYNYSQDCRNIVEVCLVRNRQSVLNMNLGVGVFNNVFLRKFESNVLRHNISEVCRNITKVCLFVFGSFSNLFWIWGVH